MIKQSYKSILCFLLFFFFIISIVQPQDSKPEEKREDLFVQDEDFEKYVDVVAVGKALAEGDAAVLADAALQWAKVEALSQRKHRSGLSSDSLVEAAIDLAIMKKDEETLERLCEAALLCGKQEWVDSVDIAKKLAQESRAIEETVSLDGLSPEACCLYYDCMKEIQLSRITKNPGILKGWKEKIHIFPAKIQKHLLKCLAQVQEESPETASEESSVMAKLAKGSRGEVQPYSFLAKEKQGNAHKRWFNFYVRVNKTKPDGKSWDILGGEPDVKVYIYKLRKTSEGEDEWDIQYVSDVMEDTRLTKMVNPELQVSLGDSLYIKAVDQDLKSNDRIGEATLKIEHYASGSLSSRSMTVSYFFSQKRNISDFLVEETPDKEEKIEPESPQKDIKTVEKQPETDAIQKQPEVLPVEHKGENTEYSQEEKDLEKDLSKTVAKTIEKNIQESPSPENKENTESSFKENTEIKVTPEKVVTNKTAYNPESEVELKKQIQALKNMLEWHKDKYTAKNPGKKIPEEFDKMIYFLDMSHKRLNQANLNLFQNFSDHNLAFFQSCIENLEKNTMLYSKIHDTLSQGILESHNLYLSFSKSIAFHYEEKKNEQIEEGKKQTKNASRYKGTATDLRSKTFSPSTMPPDNSMPPAGKIQEEMEQKIKEEIEKQEASYFEIHEKFQSLNLMLGQTFEIYLKSYKEFLQEWLAMIKNTQQYAKIASLREQELEEKYSNITQNIGKQKFETIKDFMIFIKTSDLDGVFLRHLRFQKRKK